MCCRLSLCVASCAHVGRVGWRCFRFAASALVGCLHQPESTEACLGSLGVCVIEAAVADDAFDAAAVVDQSWC